jgi:hypothetical protein
MAATPTSRGAAGRSGFSGVSGVSGVSGAWMFTRAGGAASGVFLSARALACGRPFFTLLPLAILEPISM